ncbi:MAG: hypothetical protein ABI158_14350 [Edaphobacter sp.]
MKQLLRLYRNRGNKLLIDGCFFESTPSRVIAFTVVAEWLGKHTFLCDSVIVAEIHGGASLIHVRIRLVKVQQLNMDHMTGEDNELDAFIP